MMPRIQRSTLAPRAGRLPLLVATVWLCLAATTALGCDEDTSTKPHTTPASAASSTSAAVGGAAAGGLAIQDAAAPRGSGPAVGERDAAPDAARWTDGPPTARATVQPAATASPAASATPTPTSAGSSQPSATAVAPAATATPSLPPGGSPVELPGVDPATLPPPAPGSADEMAARVDEIYQPIRRFQARFEQTYQAKVAGVTKTSKGTLLVEKPSKLSMRYDPPNNNRVVSDGAIVKVYEADNQQMFQQPVARTEYPGALAFIMGRGLRASFEFTFHDKAKFPGGRVLMGKPRVRNPAYEQAFFYIDQGLLERRDPRAVRRVLVLDVQQNRNRFDFTDIQQPSRIDPAEFTFTPPAGTTLLK